jgi:hypothetical protein
VGLHSAGLQTRLCMAFIIGLTSVNEKYVKTDLTSHKFHGTASSLKSC